MSLKLSKKLPSDCIGLHLNVRYWLADRKTLGVFKVSLTLISVWNQTGQIKVRILKKWKRFRFERGWDSWLHWNGPQKSRTTPVLCKNTKYWQNFVSWWIKLEVTYSKRLVDVIVLKGCSNLYNHLGVTTNASCMFQIWFKKQNYLPFYFTTQ